MLRRGLLSFSVQEITDEGSGIWILIGKVGQTVPTVERTPCNDCKLYDLILLL